MVYFYRHMFTNHKNLQDYQNMMVVHKGGYKDVRAIGNDHIKTIIVKQEDSVHLQT